MEKYDCIVIGGGAAGLTVARGANGLGKKTLLIEKHKIGGDCTHYGCVPSKTFIDISTRYYEAARAKDKGITGEITLDWTTVMKRVNDTVDRIYSTETPEKLKDEGIDVEIGAARFTGKHALEVNGKQYQAKRIIIATGARPRRIRGLEAHTNHTIFTLKKQPDTLAIIGGGPIGCELGQAFQRLGTQVHIIDKGEILAREDEDVRTIIRRQLIEDGARLHEHQESTLAQDEIILKDRGPLKTDAILVAIGRIPNTDDLDLEKAGVRVDEQGHIITNRYQRTHNHRIYSCGDCTTRYKFTHKANEQGRAIITNAFIPILKKKEELDAIPWVNFTSPEVAHVGVHETDAVGKVRVYKTYLEHNDRALTDDHPKGFVKIITRPFSGRIIGATIVSKDAGEMITTLTLAVKKKLSVKDLSKLIVPYPTRSDAIKRTADKWYTEYLPKLLGR